MSSWRWCAGNHGVCPLVWFPAVAGIVESGPSDIELQSGSSITVTAVSKDRLIVLSYSQRIGADGIIDERAKVVDMCRDPDTKSSIV